MSCGRPSPVKPDGWERDARSQQGRTETVTGVTIVTGPEPYRCTLYIIQLVSEEERKEDRIKGGLETHSYGVCNG
jgi:hypothetical protein